MTTQCADGEQPERARRAAERAARLLDELTRARIDVERCERQRRPLPGPARGSSGRRGASPVRRGALTGRSGGLTLGFWLITFYLLVTTLAQAPSIATDSTVYQPQPVVGATSDAPATGGPGPR